MNTLFRKTCLKATYTCFLALSVVVGAHAASLNLQPVPLYLSSKVDPNVLIDMSVETPMGGAAYNDNVGIPTGCAGRLNNVLSDSSADNIGSCYFPTTTYLGYFDPNKCYTYSTSDSRFNPAGATSATHTCTGQWSGNFLNWATMTAADMFILNMTGGNRTTDTTSLTVVRRAQNSGSTSWFPRKVLDASINVAPSTVTPYAVTTLYIHNIDLVNTSHTAYLRNTRFQLGTTFSAATGSSPTYGPFSVAVRVCDATVGLESNCVPYGTSPSLYYKPEGLVHRNASSKRFGVISYTLDNAQTRDGGVLRSNMKYVGPTLPDGTTNSAREYGTDGLLITNPDGATSGLNSGVINYINKFSEPGYKSFDPVGELFYEAIRYFKHLGPTPEYSSGITRSSSDAKSGGFWFANSASDWQEPIQYRCQKNFVIAINDANPWLDKRLPGTFFTNSTLTDASGATVTLLAGDYGQPSNADTSINVRTLTNTVGTLEGLNGTTWSSTGTWTSGTVSGTWDGIGGGSGTYSTSCTTAKTVTQLGEVMGTCPHIPKENSYYIAGLAYYANTTDLRSDLANDRGIQNVQSFFIDTQEYNSNPLDGPRNMLWLAGKYGGFVDANGDGIPQTSEWDADGDGLPDNYVLATQPQNLIDGLNKAFDFIDQRTSSASSASVNSGSISDATRVYQARFESSHWTGQLLAYQVNPADGTLITPADWDAGTLLPTWNSRQIMTVNSTGTPVAFRWSDLDSTRKNQLDTDTTVGQSKLNYLRGDVSNEGTGATAFRVRTTKLGDIISSSPVFVGVPPFNYPDALESASYSAFRTARQSRTAMVYAGANDGMLHGFNAATGVEVFAFIPSAVFGNLTNLTNKSYSHQYFVDGSPTMGDAFFGNAWHTVLIGGLGQGGQGIYALDITEPANFTEAGATSVVLWEFTDVNDPDLGYTIGQPSIVRLQNGTWAAVFGNGYNNTESNPHVAGTCPTISPLPCDSTTGAAVLYIVDIQTGSLIRKITTQVGSTTTPNGLATPAVVDFDGDGNADYVFAGDLLGNLWKFDIHDTNPTNWRVAYTDSSGNPAPLYVAQDSATPTPNSQPITSRPEVSLGPGGEGMVVLVGTGKYVEPTDKLLTPRLDQSFYGILDNNTGTSSDIVSGRSALQQQTIVSELNVTTTDGNQYNVRVTSDNEGNGVRGWYIDLVSPVQGYQAEKQVSRPLLRNGRIIFTTLVPDADPCNFGGTSWLMELDALTGRRLTESPFDLVQDNTFSTEDLVTVSVSGTPMTIAVSGLQSTVGVTQTPGVAVDPSNPVEYKYTPGTSGEISVIVENPGPRSIGRQAWRQLQ